MSSRRTSPAEARFIDEVDLSSKVSSVEIEKPSNVPFWLIKPVVVIGDLATIVLSSMFAGIAYHWLALNTSGSIETFIALGILVSFNFVAITGAQDNYSIVNLINGYRQVSYVALSWCLICLTLLSVAFILKISGDFSRGATLSFFFLGLIALLGARLVVARGLTRALAVGAFAQKQVVLITERGLDRSSRALRELSRCGYSPVATIEISPTEVEAIGVSRSLREKLDKVIACCQHHPIEHVFLLLQWGHQQFISELLQTLRIIAIPVHLLPDEKAAQLLSARPVTLGTVRTVELQRAPLDAVERAWKRAIDLFGATALLSLLAPLLLMITILIKLDSHGPVLFKQKRNGFNGRIFAIYKFRTMHVLEDGDSIPQARRNDPRVTRIGRWLRRTSFDELPQLINVLRGEMSLVGPRPHAVAHDNQYQTAVANYAFRRHVKPGLTGWAQVNGFRGETRTVEAMARRVECDLWYINRWSLRLDFRILLKTLIVSYRQPMAY